MHHAPVATLRINGGRHLRLMSHTCIFVAMDFTGSRREQSSGYKNHSKGLRTCTEFILHSSVMTLVFHGKLPSVSIGHRRNLGGRSKVNEFWLGASKVDQSHMIQLEINCLVGRGNGVFGEDVSHACHGGSARPIPGTHPTPQSLIVQTTNIT